MQCEHTQLKFVSHSLKAKLDLVLDAMRLVITVIDRTRHARKLPHRQGVNILC